MSPTCQGLCHPHARASVTNLPGMCCVDACLPVDGARGVHSVEVAVPGSMLHGRQQPKASTCVGEAAKHEHGLELCQKKIVNCGIPLWKIVGVAGKVRQRMCCAEVPRHHTHTVPCHHAAIMRTQPSHHEAIMHTALCHHTAIMHTALSHYTQFALPSCSHHAHSAFPP